MSDTKTFTQNELNQILADETKKTRLATEAKLKKNFIEKTEFEALQNKTFEYEKKLEEFENSKFEKNLKAKFIERGGNSKLFTAFKSQFKNDLKVTDEKEFNKKFSTIMGNEENEIYFSPTEISADVNKKSNQFENNSNPEFYPNSTIIKYKN